MLLAADVSVRALFHATDQAELKCSATGNPQDRFRILRNILNTPVVAFQYCARAADARAFLVCDVTLHDVSQTFKFSITGHSHLCTVNCVGRDTTSTRILLCYNAMFGEICISFRASTVIQLLWSNTYMREISSIVKLHIKLIQVYLPVKSYIYSAQSYIKTFCLENDKMSVFVSRLTTWINFEANKSTVIQFVGEPFFLSSCSERWAKEERAKRMART